MAVSPILSLVIPVYQGKKQIGAFLPELITLLESQDASWEIILVDDGSDDGSYEEILRFHRRDSRIRGARMDKHRGQQNALYGGLSLCRGQYVVTMDDDGQHPPRSIPELIAAMDEGYDVVYSLRREDRRSFSSRLGTAGTDLFLTLFCAKPRSIHVGSFRIMNRKTVERLAGMEGEFVYLSALIFSLKPKVRVKNIFHDAPNKLRAESRFSLMKRASLFVELFRHYGPFKACIGKNHGTPFSWGSVI